MRFSFALAAFASVLSVYAVNIPMEVEGINDESPKSFSQAAAQSDGASVLSSVASDVMVLTGAIPSVTSAAASAVKEATSALPSVISGITSAAGGAINTATSAAEGAFNTATSEIPNIVSDATGVIGGATAAVGGLIGAGVRIDASALSLFVGAGVACQQPEGEWIVVSLYIGRTSNVLHNSARVIPVFDPDTPLHPFEDLGLYLSQPGPVPAKNLRFWVGNLGSDRPIMTLRGENAMYLGRPKFLI
ncbi:hypothetical protein GGX14DRAFT_395936 [Mycena pura]|uniref:Uncharacterized protein n=1 Tax=Mycena pura TaxID=153505 RepID=A0AAD6VFH9_9AGAR|nr:hypothetical protein GGX14DRAFT_395936 [Mycena pura]